MATAICTLYPTPTPVPRCITLALGSVSESWTSVKFRSRLFTALIRVPSTAINSPAEQLQPLAHLHEVTERFSVLAPEIRNGLEGKQWEGWEAVSVSDPFSKPWGED